MIWDELRPGKITPPLPNVGSRSPGASGLVLSVTFGVTSATSIAVVPVATIPSGEVTVTVTTYEPASFGVNERLAMLVTEPAGKAYAEPSRVTVHAYVKAVKKSVARSISVVSSAL